MRFAPLRSKRHFAANRIMLSSTNSKKTDLFLFIWSLPPSNLRSPAGFGRTSRDIIMSRLGNSPPKHMKTESAISCK